MIRVYLPENSEYEKNGDAVLTPDSCTVTEKGGAAWELSLSHPLDPDGKWEYLQCERLIKAPVPPEVIKNAFSGIEADVYTTDTDAPLRDGQSEPQPISYMDWTYLGTYSPGDRVTVYGQGNFQCISDVNENTPYFMHPPENEPGAWKRIASMTAGSPVLVTLVSGTEVFFLENAGNGWYKVMTVDGITGYIKSSQLTYTRHQDAEQLPDKVITEQLFRIYEVSIDNSAKRVNVNARQASYDLAGNLIGSCVIAQASPAMAIMLIRNALMIPYAGKIATNMLSADFGTYSGDLSGKNGTYALLDPDKGMISKFRAQLKRDNWDIYILKNDAPDSGVRIRYGNNMKGVVWRQNTAERINRVVPVAKTEAGTDLYLPEVWIDSPNFANDRVIRMQRLKVDGQIGKDDGTETNTKWTEETLLQKMRTAAEERFSVDHADSRISEVSVDFVLLGDTEEFRQYRGMQQLSMYDLITVEEPNIGLEEQLQVSEIEWDAIRCRINKIKCGNLYDYGGKNVSGYSIANNSIELEKLSQSAIDNIAGGAIGGGASGRAVSIANNLNTTAEGFVLDARQGKALNDSKVTSTSAFISSNASKTFTCSNGFRGAIYVTGVNNNLFELILIATSSSGAVRLKQTLSPSGLTITTGTGTVTIANGTANQARVDILEFDGTAT